MYKILEVLKGAFAGEWQGKVIVFHIVNKDIHYPAKRIG